MLLAAGSCNPGHTFFHATCTAWPASAKVGRDQQISLIDEGLEGLARLGSIADVFLLRQGGCSGYSLSGTCGTCTPLVTLYRKAKALLAGNASMEGGETRWHLSP